MATEWDIEVLENKIRDLEEDVPLAQEMARKLLAIRTLCDVHTSRLDGDVSADDIYQILNSGEYLT